MLVFVNPVSSGTNVLNRVRMINMELTVCNHVHVKTVRRVIRQLVNVIAQKDGRELTAVKENVQMTAMEKIVVKSVNARKKILNFAILLMESAFASLGKLLLFLFSNKKLHFLIYILAGVQFSVVGLVPSENTAKTVLKLVTVKTTQFVIHSMAPVSVLVALEEKNAKTFVLKGHMDKIVSCVASARMEQVVHLRLVSVSVNRVGEDGFATGPVSLTAMEKDVQKPVTAQILENVII